VVFRINLDAVEKKIILLLPRIEPGLSSPSLYRLSYPGFVENFAQQRGAII
jgi:hypothetical protein